MNRTRVNSARVAGRLLVSLLFLAGLSALLPQRASAAETGDSPYIGDPVVTASQTQSVTNSSGQFPQSQTAPTLTVGGLSDGGNSADLDPYFQVPGGGHGIMGRIGHIVGDTVGRNDSLTHIDLQPYTFLNQNMFFGDLRLYRLNDSGVGGNLGGGWRTYLPNRDVVFGAVGYYDVDDTRQQQFEQLGLSLELLSRWVDLRANWYVPIGDKDQVLGTSFISGSQRFVGNLLLFDTVTTFSSAAEGVDATLTTPVPWWFLEPYNVEASAGFYHFQVRDSALDKVWGYRLRMDASFFDRALKMFLELTNDRQFDTNVVFGFSLDYYGGFESRSRLNDRQYYRMGEWVRRNYNVVTVDSDVVNVGVPVVNPTTGLPYMFAHVANNPTTGGPPDGTVDNPFVQINNALVTVPGADVYYVHGGSTFDGLDATIPVPDDKILLGEGVPQELPAVGFTDPVTLPVVRPGIVTLTNSVGSAFTAGDNVLVGGFTVVNPGANGVNVNGVVDGAFRDLTIQGANGDGVLMLNPTGNFLFERVRVAAADGIDGAGGVAFHVDGGNAGTIVTDDTPDPATAPTFENSGGNPNEVILIENTTGGFVNLASTAASDDGGGGIRVVNNFGNVTLGSGLLANTMVGPGVSAGLELTNNAANTTIIGDITIDNAAGVGFLVQDLPVTGMVNVSGTSDITVNNRNDIGADFRNINGTVRFSQAVGANAPASLSIGPIAGANATHPGVRFSTSTGSVIVNDLSVDGSLAEGVLIGDVNGIDVNTSTARFVATGTTIISNVGTLDDLDTPSIRIQGSDTVPEAASVDFQGTVNINQRLARGIHIENTSLDVDGMRSLIAFSGTTTVNNDNATPSGRAAVFIRNGAGAINFQTFTANDNILDNVLMDSAVDVQDVIGGVSFTDIRINNATGTGADLPVAGLHINNVANFSTIDGAIEVFNETAVNIENSGYQVTLSSVDSINTDMNILPEFGIRLVNNDGNFRIIGDGANLSSGGTISNTADLLAADGTVLIEGAGLFADDADEVFINLQDYLNNRRGLQFQNMNEDETQGFILDGLQVTNSEREAVLATNVRNILIEDSFFQNNGFADLDPDTGVLHSDTIRINVTQVPDDPLDPIDQDFPENFPYTYTIQRNQFLDTQVLQGAEGVSIFTSTGNSSGARLDLFFLDNNFVVFDRVQNLTQGTADRPALLATNWDGIINAEIRRNAGNLGNGFGQTGFDILQTSPDDPFASRINLTDNLLTFGDGPGLLGANFEFVGRTLMTIDNNSFTLGSSDLNSTALQFRLLALNNLIDITNNLFLFNNGGTGVNVLVVNDGSTFFIEGNQIGGAGALADRGFRFGTINGTANLLGIAPNFVNLVIPVPNNFFSIGSGAVNGQININGTFVP